MKVTITIKDNEDHTVDVSVDFDPPLKTDRNTEELKTSGAAHMASRFLGIMRQEAEENANMNAAIEPEE